MGYSDVLGHRSMVFDGARNAAYARALEKVIGPRTIVMDLGAGLGEHGMFAAGLGAAAVYLIEPTSVIEVTRKVVADNGFDNVTCLRTTAEELQLDTKVDVITSVFTGNFLLTEDLLPSLFHARDRFLAAGGKLVPDRGRMEVVPVCATDYYQRHVQAWAEFPRFCVEHRLPGIDYTEVRSCAANYLFYDSADNFAARQLAAPAQLMELDFYTARRAHCDHAVEVEVEEDGLCHGWMGWFQIRLEDEWFSTDGTDNTVHWSQVFLPLDSPVAVKRGDCLNFALQRPEGADWTWTTSHGGRQQRQSTFLSQRLRPADLLKQSDNYRPALSEKGEAAQWLLAHMQGDHDIVVLAARMAEAFPDSFSDERLALRFVRSLSDKWT